MRTVIIYDDTGRKSEVISDIIGDKGFSDVVVKKKRLEEYYRDEVVKEYPNATWKKYILPLNIMNYLGRWNYIIQKMSGLCIAFQII